MKYKNFLLRAVNLLLILGVLWQYQQVALIRAAAVSQRKQEIAEVEAYNASVLQAQSAAQAEQSGYRDGIYEGSAYGFGDVIRVSVTIQNGKMTDIAVLDASGEDKPYYKQALPLLDEMLAVQSAGVDTVSGATYSSKGYRVLVFAQYEGTLDRKPLTEPVLPLCFVMLANPIRKGAKETFTYFAENDVDIKVISGDNPLTVSVIAAEAGIVGAERFVDASTLKEKEDYYRAVEEYTVFGRVTPSQKRMLVQALKEHKKTVAMTGDGVNDVLALKDADCSVAMASGSEAASNVAQLVLLDSDFSRMPSVVAEGRRVVNNIERTAALYIVKNIFSMLLAIFSVILMLDYPLEPSQVSLISMFTIGIPSFVLALEPNKELIRGHFLTNVLVRALPAGLTDFIVVSGLVIFCREFQVDLDCLSTSCTILVAIVGFMILHRIARPMNTGHIVMLVGVIAGWILCMLFGRSFFGITEISKQCEMLMVIFAIITEPVLRYLSLIVEWISARCRMIHARFSRA